MWERQKVEELTDRWRESIEEQQGEIRSSVIAHAIRYRLVTRFTSLVAVEEKIVNPGGQSTTAAAANELPAGWKLEPVFGRRLREQQTLFLKHWAWCCCAPVRCSF